MFLFCCRLPGPKKRLEDVSLLEDVLLPQKRFPEALKNVLR
jgi:hypothetical protein